MSPATNSDLLIEMGCEDLPARYVQPLAQALAQGLVEGLAQRGIGHGAATVCATPRRIAAAVAAVADRQPNQDVERKGPSLEAAFKDDQPTRAAQGFARSCGVEVTDLARQDGYLLFRSHRAGQPTAAMIPEIFDEAVKRMDAVARKRMRWGDRDETFVRPVHWLVALLGDAVVPLTRFGCAAGRQTFGHRFHAPQAITLHAPGEYVMALRDAKVEADFSARCDTIRHQVEAQVKPLGGRARIDAGLLDEVTALVEWPVAITGRFDERFLALPPEVIVTTIETNQRYFPVFDVNGALLPHFVTVANIESKDVAQVVAGNERVVRPRLADALFFWEQDRKQSLASYAEKFTQVTYQKDLGTLATRVERLQTLAAALATTLGEDVTAAERAAALCKCDLGTRMVGEFPELQGVMGGHYARADGEPESVAAAIGAHYLPTQYDTPIPATATGRIVALADKLDQLAGYFAVGLKPTASKDPFALRRAALGVLRICIEGALPLDLRECLRSALTAQPPGSREPATVDDLLAFVMDRLRAWRAETGSDGSAIAAETFEAVAALGITQPLDFEHRLRALRAFAGTRAAASLAAADKRARNLLRQAGDASSSVDPARLEDAAERTLLAALEAAESDLQPLRARADYSAMLNRLAELKDPVDAFFDGVMVMAENPVVRANRLALLARLDALCREVADLSTLPG